MANEARVQSSLTILKRSAAGVVQLDYNGRPGAFTATVTGTKGPTPGAVTVTAAGTDVDLSGLTTPGLCRVMNQDGSNNIQLGLWEADTTTFRPFLLLKPGESFVLRLDPDLQEEYSGAGTGTTGGAVTLRAKAANASSVLLVEAFED